MKNYVVITTDCNGYVYSVYLEKDIWKAAEYAVQECVNYAQTTKYESIELVEKLNEQEPCKDNRVEVNLGPKFFITIWQK